MVEMILRKEACGDLLPDLIQRNRFQARVQAFVSWTFIELAVIK